MTGDAEGGESSVHTSTTGFPFDDRNAGGTDALFAFITKLGGEVHSCACAVFAEDISAKATVMLEPSVNIVFHQKGEKSTYTAIQERELGRTARTRLG